MPYRLCADSQLCESHSMHSWQEISTLETTNAEEGKQGKSSAALCGDRKAQSASEGRKWMAFVRLFGARIIMTVTWIQQSVYFVVQRNSHNFKRGRVAVNGWGHQWFTWPLAVRTLWNGVLKAEHQKASSGPANSHYDCKRKGNSSLLGMGQWAISLVTPTRMEKYHHP